MTQLELFNDTVSILHEIHDLELKISNWNIELRNKKVHLQLICIHPEDRIEDKVEDKVFNCDGSYYNFGYSEHWRRCTICGIESEKTRKSDGCYG